MATSERVHAGVRAGGGARGRAPRAPQRLAGRGAAARGPAPAGATARGRAALGAAADPARALPAAGAGARADEVYRDAVGPVASTGETLALPARALSQGLLRRSSELLRRPRAEDPPRVATSCASAARAARRRTSCPGRRPPRATPPRRPPRPGRRAARRGGRATARRRADLVRADQVGALADRHRAVELDPDDAEALANLSSGLRAREEDVRGPRSLAGTTTTLRRRERSRQTGDRSNERGEDDEAEPSWGAGEPTRSSDLEPAQDGRHRRPQPSITSQPTSPRRSGSGWIGWAAAGRASRGGCASSSSSIDTRRRSVMGGPEITLPSAS